MKKRIVSLLLALAMLLGLASGLAAPASALTTGHLPRDENIADSTLLQWDGPSLTAHSVVSRGGGILAALDTDVHPMYWVLPGGGFTLEMPFPTANRQYTVDVAGMYRSDSKKQDTWGSFTGRTTYTQADGRSHYDLACTEDMGGDDKFIRVSVTWADYDGAAVRASGEAIFYIEVVITPVFTDVPYNAYYAKPVEWAVKQGITSGTSQLTFSPGDPCTTAHILTFLWRNVGRPGASGTNMSWNDELAVITSWARSKGMTLPGNLNTVCTRAAAVTYMWRAAGSTPPQSTAAFTDVPASADYGSAVSWALEKGITDGTSSKTFSPNEGCNRGQIVTFLYRQEVEPLTPSTPVTPPDLTAADVPSTPLVNEDGRITITGVMLLRTSVPDLPASTRTKGHFSLTQLAVGLDWTRAHGENYTVSWSVDNPGIVTLKETVVNGFEAVQINSGSTPGNAIITCTVTGEDGHQDRAYCYVTVIGSGQTTPTTPTAPTAPTTPTTPSTGSTAEQMCARVVELVNQERAKQGLSPLSTLPNLTAAANIRAPELVTKFSHDRPDGSSCFTALGEANVTYGYAGENIAVGQATPEAVMNSWMNSPGHKANILSANYTHIGVGYYNGCWVQMFISTR